MILACSSSDQAGDLIGRVQEDTPAQHGPASCARSENRMDRRFRQPLAVVPQPVIVAPGGGEASRNTMPTLRWMGAAVIRVAR